MADADAEVVAMTSRTTPRGSVRGGETGRTISTLDDGKSLLVHVGWFTGPEQIATLEIRSGPNDRMAVHLDRWEWVSLQEAVASIIRQMEPPDAIAGGERA